MEQLSFPLTPMQAARVRANAGIQRAAEAAERLTPNWTEIACDAVRAWVRERSSVFTMEHARLAVEKSIEPPSDLRAWGHVTRMAVKRGYIEQVPGSYFRAASSNGSPKPVYRKGEKA